MYRLTCQIKQASFEIKIYHQVFFSVVAIFSRQIYLEKNLKKILFFLEQMQFDKNSKQWISAFLKNLLLKMRKKVV